MNLQLINTSVENLFRAVLKSTVLISAVSSILFVSGCATQAPQVEQVVEEPPQMVWPLPPEQARIRYLGDLSEMKLPEKKKGLADILLGEEEDVRIAMLAKPYGVYSDSKGRVFVADTGIAGLAVFDTNKNNTATVWGTTGVGAIAKPTGVTGDAQGNVYVSDPLNSRIVVFDSEGEYVNAFGGKEVIEYSGGLVFSDLAQKLYVVDTKKHQVIVFDKEGNVEFTIGENGTDPGYFNFPTNIAVDANGRIYVSDGMNFRVQVFEKDGTYVSHFGQNGQRIGDFHRLKGIGVDQEGHIYAVDSSFQNIQIFNQQGQLLLYFGDGGSGEPGRFAMAAGIHVDKNNKIFVADQYNRRIQMFEFLDDSPVNNINK